MLNGKLHTSTSDKTFYYEIKKADSESDTKLMHSWMNDYKENIFVTPQTPEAPLYVHPGVN